MHARRVVFFAALLLVSAFLTPALAKEGISLLTPFDATVVRQSGPPTQVSQTVTLPTATGQWWLTLENQGATSGTVTLNGTQVFGPSDLKRGVTILRAPVTVTASTTISVGLAGSPGESVRVHLDGVVPDSAIPPSLVRHLFQRTFFAQTFAGSGTATINLPTSAGLFWLGVQNGTAAGTSRASSATIALGGVTVFGPSSFSQAVGALEAPVLVSTTNALAVSLTAPSGSQVTVTLRGYGVDTDPPQLAFVAPPPAVWQRLVGNVQLAYSDAISGVDTSTFTMTANGVTVTSTVNVGPSAAAAPLSSLYPPLHEGSNDLVATVQDMAANTATARTTVLVDTVPPVISVSPSDHAIVRPTQPVTVHVTDPTPGSGVASFHADLDGQDVTALLPLVNGTASGTLTMALGDHVLHLVALDNAQNQSEQFIHWTARLPLPVVTVTPGDGQATNDTVPTIVVTHQDPDGPGIDLASVTLLLDGQPLAPIAQVASETAFFPSTPLSAGAHALSIHVADLAGTAATLDTTFKVELVATHLALSIAPADSSSVLVNTLNDLTIRALTASNLPASKFTGTIHVTTTDGLATLDDLFADMTLADEGVLVVRNLAIVRRAGPLTISAVAVASPSVLGSLDVTGSTTVPTFSVSPIGADGVTTLTIKTVPNGTVQILVDGAPMGEPLRVGAAGTLTTSFVLQPGPHSVQVVAKAPDGSDAGRSAFSTLGPPVTVSGVVFDGSTTIATPLPGVTASIEGTSVAGVTDAGGKFTLRNVPLGTQVLALNGSTLPTNFGLTRIGLSLTASTTMPAVVLNPIDLAGGAAIPISPSGAIPTLTATSSTIPNAIVQVPAGTVTLPSEPAQPVLTISRVDLVDLPLHPPEALASSLFVSVGPEGARFSNGLHLTLPNGDGVQPGQTTNVWHYSPELNRWEIVAQATASADGTVLVDDERDTGIFAMQAPQAFVTRVSIMVSDPSGSSVASLGDLVLLSGQALQSDAGPLGGPSGPNLVNYVTPTLPFPVSVRATRYFQDGTVASVSLPFTIDLSLINAQNALNGKGWIKEIRVGHPATVTGTVASVKHGIVVQLNPSARIPVRNAQVFCNGVSATTDYMGRFRLTNVPIWNPDPNVGTFSVFASKFVGASFGGGVSQSSSIALSNNTCDVGQVAIDADLFQAAPHITTETVASLNGDNRSEQFVSLLYHQATNRFYTENLAGFDSIREIDPVANTWSTVADTFGRGGLQINNMALASDVTQVKDGLIDPGARLWVTEGHEGTVYLVGVDRARGNFGQKAEIATNLNPLWGFLTPVDPLADTTNDSGGNVLVQFGTTWWEADTLNGAHLLGNANQQGIGLTHDTLGQFYIASADGPQIILFHPEILPLGPNGPQNSMQPINFANPLTFSPQQLTLMPLTNTYFAGIVGDTPVPGYAKPAGSTVRIIRKSDGKAIDVYHVPDGSLMKVFGVAWGPGSPDNALYVLQSNITEAVTSGNGAPVRVELVKVQSIGGWAQAYAPPIADTDRDGLPDDIEIALGSNPNSPHSDGGTGTVDDYVKLVNMSVNPNSRDSDGDGLADADEFTLGTDYSSFTTVSVGPSSVLMAPNASFVFTGSVTAPGVKTGQSVLSFATVTLISSDPGVFTFDSPSGPVTTISGYTGGAVTLLGNSIGQASIIAIVNGVSYPITTVSVQTDTLSPILDLNIQDGSMTCDAFPEIVLSYADPPPASGVATGSINLRLDGATLLRVDEAPGSSTYYPNAPLNAGQHSVTATVFDMVGNSATLTRTFTVMRVTGGTLLTTTPPEPQNNPAMAAASVLLTNGQVFLTRVDLAVPGRGEANFTFARTYRSYVQSDGLMGPGGWTHNYDMRVKRCDASTIQWLTGSGRMEEFTLQPDGSYKSPTGFFARLLGNDSQFVIREPNGLKYIFNSLSDPIAPGCLATIRDRHGNKLTFQYGTTGTGFGKIARVTDPYDRVYVYAYDLAGRVFTVTDFSGRTVTFRYSADGDLVKVTSPPVITTTTGGAIIAENQFPAGRSEIYGYTSGNSDIRLNHKLVVVVAPNEGSGVTDPQLTDPAFLKSKARVENTWDLNPFSPTAGRILSQRLGGTNATGVSAGGTFTFSYQRTVPSGADPINDEVQKVTVTDPRTNVSDYFLNTAGQCVRARRYTRGIRATDPAYFESQKRYNGDGLTTSLQLPLGNQIAFTFDSSNVNRNSQGNLLAKVVVPDAARGDSQGGTAPRIVTFTYEPIYNMLRTFTEERAYNPLPGPTQPYSYVVQNDPTNTRGISQVARYTTTRYFDYEQGRGAVSTLGVLAAEVGLDSNTVASLLQAAGIVLDQGDLNRDGTDDLFTSGDVVKIAAPSVTLDSCQKRAIAAAGSNVQSMVTLIAHNAYGQVTRIIDPEQNVDTCSYYSSFDPDGDGTNVPGTTQTDSSGGYPNVTVHDSQLAAGRESGTNPTPAAVTTKRFYDPVGNVIGFLDARGIRHDRDVNPLNEVVRSVTASDTSLAYSSRDRALPALSYESLTIFDANGNVVETRIGNQGERDGSGASVASNPYWSTKVRYDILDSPIMIIREVTPTANDSAITETTPGVTVTRYAYDPNENLVLLTKPEANTVSYAHDERDLLYTTTRGPGTSVASTFTRNYDLNGNLQSLVDGTKNNPAKNAGITNGDVFTVVRDGFDRPVEITDPELITTRVLYDPAGHAVRIVRYGSPEEGTPRLSESLQYWDEAGRLFQTASLAFRYDNPGSSNRVFDLATPVIDAPAPTGEAFATKVVDFDRLGRPIRTVDMKGDETLLDFDGAGRVLQALSPEFGPAANYPGSTFVRNSFVYSYDGAGHVVKKVETRASPLSTVPGANVSNILLTTDYVQDAVGRTIRVSDPMNRTSRFYFDSRSNLIDKTDARSSVTVVDPLNLRGGPTTINGDGNVCRYFYDGLSRRVRTEELLKVNGVGDGDPNLQANTSLDTSNPAIPSGLVVTQTAFDGNDRVTSKTDPNANVTSVGYDALDRVILETFANGTSQSKAYDADDNLVQTIDPNGSLVRRSYDGLNRLVRVDVANRATNLSGTGQNVLGTTLQAFEWDGLSRVRSAIDDNGAPATLGVATDFVFDSISRKLKERHRINASVGANNTTNTIGRLSVTSIPTTIDRTVESGYQAPTGFAPSTLCVPPVMPVRTSLAYPVSPSSSPVMQLGVDGLDRTQTISEFNTPNVQQATYDYLGPDVVQRELPCVSTKDVYDQDCGCPIAIQSTVTAGASAGSFACSFEYDYDGDYNRNFERRVDQVGSPQDNFSYDSLNRATKADFGVVGAQPPLSATTYQFDGATNFTAKTEGGVTTKFNTPAAAYMPDALNRYTNVKTFVGAALIGTDAPVHDSAGARIQQSDRHLFFDATDRLVQVDRFVAGSFQTVGRYTYDAFGRRVTKRADIFDASGTLVRQDNLAFICDGQQEIEEVDLGNGSLQAAYIYGASDVDEVIRMQRAGADVVFSSNAQLSVVVATSAASGDPVERYDYSGSLYGKHVVMDSSGSARSLAQEIRNPFRFHGRRFDDESGLYYFRNRYLDPEEGRFVNRDPIGIWGDAQNMGNGYAFCGGNPANRRDPLGLDGQPWVGFRIANAIIKTVSGGTLELDMEAADRKAAGIVNGAGTVLSEPVKEFTDVVHLAGDTIFGTPHDQTGVTEMSSQLGNRIQTGMAQGESGAHAGAAALGDVTIMYGKSLGRAALAVETGGWSEIPISGFEMGLGLELMCLSNNPEVQEQGSDLLFGGSLAMGGAGVSIAAQGGYFDDAGTPRNAGGGRTFERPPGGSSVGAAEAYSSIRRRLMPALRRMYMRPAADCSCGAYDLYTRCGENWGTVYRITKAGRGGIVIGGRLYAHHYAFEMNGEVYDPFYGPRPMPVSEYEANLAAENDITQLHAEPVTGPGNEAAQAQLANDAASFGGGR